MRFPLTRVEVAGDVDAVKSVVYDGVVRNIGAVSEDLDADGVAGDLIDSTDEVVLDIVALSVTEAAVNEYPGGGVRRDKVAIDDGVVCVSDVDAVQAVREAGGPVRG